MILIRLEPAEALAAWEGLGNLLRPAIERGDMPEAAVKARIGADVFSAWVGTNGRDLGAIVTRSEPDSLRVFYAAGTKALTRETIDLLSQAAKRAGRKEITFGCRRGFKRWFPDFESTDCPDGRVEMRKAL